MACSSASNFTMLLGYCLTKFSMAWALAAGILHIERSDVGVIFSRIFDNFLAGRHIGLRSGGGWLPRLLGSGRLLCGRLLGGGLLRQSAHSERKHKRDKHFSHFKSLLLHHCRI